MDKCWFCDRADGEMAFTVEFDAYFHKECLTAALAKQDPYDREAVIIGREFGLVENDTVKS